MNIEINRSYTFGTLLDSKCKCACFYSRDKACAADKHLISKLEERFNQGRSALISADNGGPENDTDVRTIKMTSPGISFFGVP